MTGRKQASLLNDVHLFAYYSTCLVFTCYTVVKEKFELPDVYTEGPSLFAFNTETVNKQSSV